VILKLKFVREARSGRARLYENPAGARHWVPRSVCPRVMKFSETEHEVTIEDWWLAKNPWPANKQKELPI